MGQAVSPAVSRMQQGQGMPLWDGLPKPVASPLLCAQQFAKPLTGTDTQPLVNLSTSPSRRHFYAAWMEGAMYGSLRLGDTRTRTLQTSLPTLCSNRLTNLRPWRTIHADQRTALHQWE